MSGWRIESKDTRTNEGYMVASGLESREEAVTGARDLARARRMILGAERLYVVSPEGVWEEVSAAD